MKINEGLGFYDWRAASDQPSSAGAFRAIKSTTPPPPSPLPGRYGPPSPVPPPPSPLTLSPSLGPFCQAVTLQT